jgi:hypothetical protein
MHGAAYQSWPKVIELLQLHKANIKIWDRKNKAGWTPLLIAQGHRPGNFRLSPETVAMVERFMRAQGVTPPKATRFQDKRRWDN